MFGQFLRITSTLSGQPYQQVSHGSAKIYDYLDQVGYTSELILSGDHLYLADLPVFMATAPSGFTRQRWSDC